MTALAPRAATLARRVPTLACATYGAGKPLLLIRSFGVSSTPFDGLIASLTPHFFVIVPDLHSDTATQMAADLDELLDRLRVPCCVALGYAEGGTVAQQFARAFPQRINGLVLVNTLNTSTGSLREVIEGRLRAGFARLAGLPVNDSAPAHLHCPTLVVASAADATAVSNAHALADQLPNVQLRLTPGCADKSLSEHAPALAERVMRWLHEQPAR